MHLNLLSLRTKAVTDAAAKSAWLYVKQGTSPYILTRVRLWCIRLLRGSAGGRSEELDGLKLGVAHG